MRVYILEAVDPELRRKRLAGIAKALKKSRDAHMYWGKVAKRHRDKSPGGAWSKEHDDASTKSFKAASKGTRYAKVLATRGEDRPGVRSYVRGSKALKNRYDGQLSWRGGKAHQADWFEKGHLLKGATYKIADRTHKEKDTKFIFTGKFGHGADTGGRRAKFTDTQGRDWYIHPHAVDHEVMKGGSFSPFQKGRRFIPAKKKAASNL